MRNTINHRDRLIFALDVSSTEEAKQLVKELGDSVNFYKVGWELFLTDGYFELIRWLNHKGKKVFADLKIFDVPETVARAIKKLKYFQIAFLTIHGQNDQITQAACMINCLPQQAKEKNNIKILAVTVLTSISNEDIQKEYKITANELAYNRAKGALENGCDGIICSGLESKQLRKLGKDFIIVSPGIRPAGKITNDDQKRICTPSEALENGSDYIVVGRPIRDASNRKEAAEKIQEEIMNFFLNQF